MTITELESIIQEHKMELEEDAEANGKTCVFMTYKDGAGGDVNSRIGKSAGDHGIESA